MAPLSSLFLIKIIYIILHNIVIYIYIYKTIIKLKKKKRNIT